MKRRAARTDRNHTEIVEALRKIGCEVLSLAALGNGAPDALAKRGSRMRLFEFKDGDLPPSARKLTPLEARFYDRWHPHVVVVTSPEQAIEAMVSA